MSSGAPTPQALGANTVRRFKENMDSGKSKCCVYCGQSSLGDYNGHFVSIAIHSFPITTMEGYVCGAHTSDFACEIKDTKLKNKHGNDATVLRACHPILARDLRSSITNPSAADGC